MRGIRYLPKRYDKSRKVLSLLIMPKGSTNRNGGEECEGWVLGLGILAVGK
jgi:hypothetical protein